METLFTSDLMALRKRRANVARSISQSSDRRYTSGIEQKRANVLIYQLYRTFYALTAVELSLTDKVTP